MPIRTHVLLWWYRSINKTVRKNQGLFYIEHWIWNSDSQFGVSDILCACECKLSTQIKRATVCISLYVSVHYKKNLLHLTYHQVKCPYLQLHRLKISQLSLGKSLIPIQTMTWSIKVRRLFYLRWHLMYLGNHHRVLIFVLVRKIASYFVPIWPIRGIFTLSMQ